jgi:uncharacterized protein
MFKKLVQALLAFIAGFTGVNFGLGGGIILIPALIYTGVKTKKTAATSMMLIMFISLSGSYQHTQINTALDMNMANIMLFTMGIIGALLGAIILLRSKNSTITWLITFYFLIVGLLMLFSSLYNEVEFLYPEYIPQNAYWIMGLPIALVSSMLGIGGGAILAPILIYIFQISSKTAVAMTMPFIFFLALTTTIINIKNKLIDYTAFIIMLPFALAGTLTAHFVFVNISDLHVQIGIGSLMIINALIMAIRTFNRS